MEILSLNGKNLEFGSYIIFWKLIFLMNEEICK